MDLLRKHWLLGKWDKSHIIPCTSIDTNPPETFPHLPEELLLLSSSIVIDSDRTLKSITITITIKVRRKQLERRVASCMLDNLRILQANLNKSPQATESTLQLAVELAIDLVIVQEPALYSSVRDDYSDCRSVSHQSFSQIFPQPLPSSIRPRVMAYVSRSLEAQVSPASGSSPDPDFLQLNVTSPG